MRTMTDKVKPKKWVSDGYTKQSSLPSESKSLGQSSSQEYPKTDVRYWRKRVFKPVSVRAEGKVQSEHFAIKLQSAGKRMTLSLATANREEAAQRARRMYLDLVAGGWEQLLGKHRPKPPEPEKKEGLTFGQYIALVRSRNLIPDRTLDSYLPRLRQIVAEIKGFKLSRKRFAAKGTGARQWRDKIDSLRLQSITPDDVRRWKTRSIDKAKNNAILRKQYTVSVNSTLRQARSLFGERKILKHLPEIPRPHLFEGVEFAPRVDMKFYGAGIDAPTLLRAAIKELSTKRREECKAFLLAIALGLRRKEADLLEWSSFDFAAGTVQVQPTDHYARKTRESAAALALDPEIMALFRGWHALATGPFVIESDRPPRADAGYHYYRADHVFDSLVGWLRIQGIQADKPFHVLRKLFGSLIVEQHGIFAASAALRHTSIELTNAYYVDRTVRTTSGLGAILSGAAVTEFPKPTSVFRKESRLAKKN
jgi:integrase